MGKKPKPIVHAKLFNKTNSKNFSLVFIKNIIDEAKIAAEAKQNNQLIANTMLDNLTTSKFQKKIVEEPKKDEEEDAFSEESNSLLDEEEDDEVDIAIVNHTSPDEEVYLEQLRTTLHNRNKKGDFGGDLTDELCNLEQPKNFDHLLEIVGKVLDLKCEKEKASFTSNYLIKFNVNFELTSDLSFFNFEALLSILFKLLSNDKWGKFIVEVPFDVINRLKKHMVDRRMLQHYVKLCIKNFYIGSQVNLSKFYTHFKIPINTEMQKAPILMEINFLKKFVIIYFVLDTPHRIHKIYYSFSIFRTIIFESQQTFTRVYIECTQAPMLFYADLDQQQRKDINIYDIDMCDIYNLIWIRAIKFRYLSKLRRSRNPREQEEMSPHDESLLGMSKTFCFDVPKEASDPVLRKLINVAFICRERNKTFQFFLSAVEQINAPDMTYNDLNTLLTNEAKYQFPFSIHFALLVLFSGSYKILDCLAADGLLIPFLAVIAQDAEDSIDATSLACLEQCIYYLKTQSREYVVINLYSEFLKLLKSKRDFTSGETPDDYVSIRRATLYPSHLEFVQPVSLLRSRFTDLANLEYGIRMTVRDDNGGVLNKCKQSQEYDFIMDTLKPHLLEGIKIGERVYELLGSSTSQMRDNGCTLYATDNNGRTAEDVRNSAGQLKVFNRNVSKYIARFGLVFSQSMTLIPLGDDVQVMYSKDYEGDVKPNTKDYSNVKQERYCLSDGIGIVSRTVAEQWQPYLQVKADYFPSAYQIRFGGCKGMLTVFNIKKHGIIFRNSMKKYDSDSRTMGILKYSLPRNVFLNRPLINILNHMNVDRDELYKYYYHSTASVAKATLYDSCAMDLIHTYSTGLLPYEKILNSSISLLDEPFLRSIINYLIYYRLNFELKLKARIRVPNDCGRIAFGVLDETLKLEYGQVYFQYTKLSEDGRMLNETVVLEGEVMVTKFPCLQPGDVRKFKAVNVPTLSHVKDCLVFPAKGPRSHCDEMSGSDLDGDEYAIFWDPALYFPGENRPPMDFPYGLGKSLNYDITVEDMVEFFLRYLMMNNIGVVANSHLMYSDFLPNGLDEPECEDLAYTYNISLDFPKTGYIQFMPRNRYFLAVRPDFMERNNHDCVYLSRKMLGEYYRHCALVERAIELSQYDYRFSMFNPTQKNKKKSHINVNHFKNTKSLIKNRLILSEWKRFYQQANDAFTEYRVKVIDIMEQLEVENEVMLFADVYEDKKDVAKQLLNTFFQHFQTKFLKQCEALGCTYTIDRLYLASAWYAICYEKCLTYNGKPLLGLPWLVAEEICQLAQFSFSGKVATQAALAEQMRTMIVEGEHWAITLGINHKQVVPYKLENALIHDMLFDYKTMTVYNTKVVHHYWCPFKLVNFIRDQHSHLLSLHYEILEDIQMKIVMRMAMKYLNLVKRRIYSDETEERIVLLFSENPEEEPERVLEGELLRRIIEKQLKESIVACGRKDNHGNESLPTISTIFNRLLFYLFEICNRVNAAIYHATMDEIFLLKYAVFALSFLNKLDSKLDRKFCFNFSYNFQRNWETYIFILNLIHRRKLAGEEVTNTAFFPPNGFFNDYDRCIESLFNTYLADNNFLVTETIQFYLLTVENRADLLKANDDLFPKLSHLTGVTDVEFNLSCDDPMARAHDEHYRKDDGCDGPSSSQSPTQGCSNISGFAGDQSNGFDPLQPIGQSGGANGRPDEQPEQQPKKHISQIVKLNKTSAMLRSVPYEVKTTGLVHSTQMLRLLIGHPYFFSNICPRFDIVTAVSEQK